MPEKPQGPPDPSSEPPGSPPPIQEGPKRRPTGAESTPGGVAAPLGTETYETQPLPALDALLQTNFMEVLPSTRPGSLPPHAEQHMAHGDDEVHSFDTISVYDFILMRKGHETDTGRGAQEEITAPAVPTTQVPQSAGYVARDIPVVQLESDETTDPQRIVAVLHPKQGITDTFVGLRSDQALASSKYAAVGVWGSVAAPSGTVGNMGLFTKASSTHNATPHVHLVTIDPWTHALTMPDVSGGGSRFRIGNVRDPVSAQDAATKAYVDSLVGHTLLDASQHTDTAAQTPTEGSLILSNATPKWDELVISVPAANVRNVLGVDNAETAPSWKTALDGTNPANIANAASAGTSLVFAHRDHVHAHPAGLTANLHHDPVTIHADAAHALSTQELQAVLAANGQTGHMSGAMFDALTANTAKLAGIEAGADITDATNVAGAGAVMDSDIAPGEGFLRKTGAGTYTAHKSNLAAGAAPDANEDSADGYSVGSVWIDTTNDDMYVCVDSTEAAAVWLHLNAAAAAHALLDGATHSDTVANAVTAGSIVIANDTPAWDELVIAVPAANVRNVLGIDNGETTPTWKTALDGTAPADVAAVASAGTSLVFSHRDHVHKREHVKFTASEAVTAVEAEDPLSLAGVVNLAKYIQLDEIAAPGAGGANKLRAFAKDVDGNTMLVVKDSAGKESFLPRAAVASVYRNAAFNLTNNTWTAIQFNVESVDTDGMVDLVGVDSRRIYATKAGVYLVSGNAKLTQHAVGVFLLEIVYNAASAHINVRGVAGVDNDAGVQTALNPTAVVPMNAGDYVELLAYQNSGGNLSILTYGSTPSLSMAWLTPLP